MRECENDARPATQQGNFSKQATEARRSVPHFHNPPITINFRALQYVQSYEYLIYYIKLITLNLHYCTFITDADDYEPPPSGYRLPEHTTTTSHSPTSHLLIFFKWYFILVCHFPTYHALIPPSPLALIPTRFIV